MYYRIKKISLLVVLSAIFISSCAPDVHYTPPPDLTLAPGTNIPQQTEMPLATSTLLAGESTPPVGNAATVMDSSALILYQSPALGIQFSYPSVWYRGESSNVVTLTSFDPANPPHKLEWTDQTISMQFGYKVLITPPTSFDAWVESNKQIALANGLSIYAEERFQIANQPAAHLTLVSGSGGIIHQVLTDLVGRYFEINIEGNYDLAKAVLDTIQPFSVVATAPPPIVEYNNPALGYKLNLPGDWQINETNDANKEVIFSPPYAEPFIVYLSVSLESRTLDQVINFYAQNNIIGEDTILNGYAAVKYVFASGRNEYFIPYGNQLFLIATDRPNDSLAQSVLLTFRFTTPPQPVTYDATLADNGKTFIMNIGDKIRINLDYAYGWSTISDFDPAVLRGAADGYFAFASGTSTLKINGDPICYSSTPPCLMPSFLYTITVIVQ